MYTDMREKKSGISRTVYFYAWAEKALEDAIDKGTLNEICSRAVVAEMKNNTYALEKHKAEKDKLESEIAYLDELIAEEEKARDDGVLIKASFDEMYLKARKTLTLMVKTGAINYEEALKQTRGAAHKKTFQNYAHAAQMSLEEFIQNVRKRLIEEKLIL